MTNAWPRRKCESVVCVIEKGLRIWPEAVTKTFCDYHYNTRKVIRNRYCPAQPSPAQHRLQKKKRSPCSSTQRQRLLSEYRIRFSHTTNSLDLTRHLRINLILHVPALPPPGLLMATQLRTPRRRTDDTALVAVGRVVPSRIVVKCSP